MPRWDAELGPRQRVGAEEVVSTVLEPGDGAGSDPPDTDCPRKGWWKLGVTVQGPAENGDGLVEHSSPR